MRQSLACFRLIGVVYQSGGQAVEVRLQRRNPCDPAERRMRSQAVSVAESEQISTLAFPEFEDFVKQ